MIGELIIEMILTFAKRLIKCRFQVIDELLASPHEIDQISDIVRYVEGVTGHGLNRDEGVQHGEGEREVKGVTVTWMGTPAAIRAAGEGGDDLLIVHESLYYPYDVINSSDGPVPSGDSGQRPSWRYWTMSTRLPRSSSSSISSLKFDSRPL